MTSQAGEDLEQFSDNEQQLQSTRRAAPAPIRPRSARQKAQFDRDIAPYNTFKKAFGATVAPPFFGASGEQLSPEEVRSFRDYQQQQRRYEKERRSRQIVEETVDERNERLEEKLTATLSQRLGEVAKKQDELTKVIANFAPTHVPQLPKPGEHNAPQPREGGGANTTTGDAQQNARLPPNGSAAEQYYYEQARQHVERGGNVEAAGAPQGYAQIPRTRPVNPLDSFFSNERGRGTIGPVFF